MSDNFLEMKAGEAAKALGFRTPILLGILSVVDIAPRVARAELDRIEAAGIESEQAERALHSILTRLFAPTVTVAHVLSMLGVRPSNDLAGTLDSLAQSLSGIPEASLRDAVLGIAGDAEYTPTLLHLLRAHGLKDTPLSRNGMSFDGVTFNERHGVTDETFCRRCDLFRPCLCDQKSETAPVTLRVPLEIRTRQRGKGVVTLKEVWVDTIQKPVGVTREGLDPLVLRRELDTEFGGATIVSVKEVRFQLDTYDPETRVATYKERDFRRSDAEYGWLQDYFGFRREETGNV